ncbi:MAG: hypothetical protein E7637_05520 [Ruminococcaceae bacterium]|nr:hypothetical protein [Oscillospiraceae bacterium]
MTNVLNPFHPTPESEARTRKRSLFSNPLFWLLLICTEIVFLQYPMYRFMGPIIALLLGYLYFIKRETIFVTVFIILANTDLKAVLISSVSFQQLLFAFIAVDLVLQVKLSTMIKSFLCASLALVMLLQLFLVGFMDMPSVFYTFLFAFALVLQFCQYRDRKEEMIEKLTFAIMIIVGLIALHTCITGGVTFQDEENMSIIRRGTLGVGVGDANFSCLLLCTGVASAFNCRSVNRILCWIFAGLMISAMLVTLSTTGFIALIVVLLLSVFTNVKLEKKLRNAILVVLFILLLVQIYLLLPPEYRIKNLDAYIARMESKYLALVNDDYSTLTTGRSSNAEIYLGYIHRQSPLRILFGGNTLIPPSLHCGASHNTYIDFLLRFGYVGAAILLFFVVRSFFRTLAGDKNSRYRKVSLCLKVLYLFFAFTLSIYNHATFAMMFFVFWIL